MRINQSALIGRRGELLAELFLQDLGAFSVVTTTGDFSYDLLANFENGRGGVNTYAILVKATEKPVASRFAIPTVELKKIAYSSLPTMILVADVKMNRIYHAWLTSMRNFIKSETNFTSIPIQEIDDAFKEKLVKQLRSNVRDMIEIDIPTGEFKEIGQADIQDRIRLKAIEVGLIGPDERLPKNIDIEVFHGAHYINLEVRFPNSPPKAGG